MSRARAGHLLAALLLTAALSACGQKGPLYLPDKKPEAVTPADPAASPAPDTVTPAAPAPPPAKKGDPDGSDPPQ
jgi:predicted small lipoprotein YifL